ncbi:MAG TPA: CoA pyrophosphatase [Dongiaceae bacterium]|nr:CoA pyrophosphatase [Dongiaceae bacterium]
MNELDRIRAGVPAHAPDAARLDQAQAAVLMALTDHPAGPELILTRRASHLTSHAGEVAFPGGKRDPGDNSVLITALRESHEEIALPMDQVEVIGPMPLSVSKMGLQVVPFVGIIPHRTALIPSADEIESIFRVPLQYFLSQRPLDYTERDYEGVRYRIPCFDFEGYIIWGLTAFFITDFLSRVFDVNYQVMLPTPVSP